jgi:Protein of unknown function DUF262
MYKIPSYQREYSWQKAQWEDLFQDLIEADGAHFLGDAINKLAESKGVDPGKAALRVRDAVEQAILVKIEVANHADAFVLSG